MFVYVVRTWHLLLLMQIHLWEKRSHHYSFFRFHFVPQLQPWLRLARRFSLWLVTIRAEHRGRRRQKRRRAGPSNQVEGSSLQETQSTQQGNVVPRRPVSAR